MKLSLVQNVKVFMSHKSRLQQTYAQRQLSSHELYTVAQKPFESTQ